MFLSNFFVHCTNEKLIETYLKESREVIYLCIELSKMSYTDILKMPVFELQDYIRWKVKFDKDRQEAQAKAVNRLKK